jgi:hypothetical protein
VQMCECANRLEQDKFFVLFFYIESFLDAGSMVSQSSQKDFIGSLSKNDGKFFIYQLFCKIPPPLGEAGGGLSRWWGA